ncbi:MAG: AbrB/MazE/SpoVT family DNA-binding domain-containing protein [Terracidiphilus sp.]|nr:AbrB/MazE/SpoVT family DNA-binding domain-containing protein [Terracidiphilus sp.]MDR3797376.1 AbrB/MazE/SpoVT family DNA-binding domain-containing protein [Terracidiphilus sp.]
MRKWRIAECPHFRYIENVQEVDMPAQQMTQIGTKRQLTLPKAILEYYGLGEGSHVLIEMKDNHLELHPVIPVKRNELPEELREKFLSRRGARGAPTPLSSFLDKIGYKAPQAKRPAAATKTLGTQAEQAEAER